MAVPQIANVYPRRAHATGGGMVRILGVDFGARVRVAFNGVESTLVLVTNASRLYALVPRAAASDDVTITVQNLDPEGQPIAGELATLSGVFVYGRVGLATDSVLARVTGAFLLMLRELTIDNVTNAHVHTDYDPTTGDAFNLTELQELPAIVVVGPEITAADERAQYTSEVPGFGFTVVKRGPYLADLTFNLSGFTAHARQLLNLQSLVLAALHQHPYIELPVDENDPAAGLARFDVVMDDGAAPSIEAPSDDNDVRSFGVRATIKNVPLGEYPGFADTGTDVVPPVGSCGVELTFERL